MPATSKPLGPIKRDEIYPLEDLMPRAGIGRKAIAKLRRDHGLTIYRAGRRAFVNGGEFQDAIMRSARK